MNNKTIFQSHIYGKEGSRIDRKPLPCTAIILGTAPSPLDCHGCPYKHWESAMLSERLQTLGLKSDQVTEIQGLCKMNRFDKVNWRWFFIWVEFF
jgi:DNA primase large subunit